jgi:capsular exopolysaccharide synthesis family protein
MNIGYAYGTAGPLLVTITSPGTRDGKSFISSNLALSFAEAGFRTLLIDGDVRRGELDRLLSTRRKPGLTDRLANRITIDRLVQPTAYARLSFIGGGTRMQNAPELLSSAAMSELFASLRPSFDVILVDSPPLGAGIDPYVLAAMTGHVLLVVRNGMTDRELAGAKLDMLDRLPVRILGAVLNDVQPSGLYGYYSYAYDPTDYESKDEPAAVETGRRRLPGK